MHRVMRHQLRCAARTGGPALLALIVGLPAGCAKPSEIAWNAPTTFRFAGLRESDAPIIERVFRDRKHTFRRTGDAPITYEVTSITTVRELAFVRESLDQAAKSRHLDLPLERATIDYGGLDALGTAQTTVRIEVSPGAEAYIADGVAGVPWRRVPVSGGRWSGPVRTDGMVRGFGGLLYIAARRNDVTQYYRLNILTGQQEHVSFVEFKETGLPEPSATTASRTGEAPPSSTTKPAKAQPGDADKPTRGWKWPWER